MSMLSRIGRSRSLRRRQFAAKPSEVVGRSAHAAVEQLEGRIFFDTTFLVRADFTPLKRGITDNATVKGTLTVAAGLTPDFGGFYRVVAGSESAAIEAAYDWTVTNATPIVTTADKTGVGRGGTEPSLKDSEEIGAAWVVASEDGGDNDFNDYYWKFTVGTPAVVCSCCPSPISLGSQSSPSAPSPMQGNVKAGNGSVTVSGAGLGSGNLGGALSQSMTFSNVAGQAGGVAAGNGNVLEGLDRIVPAATGMQVIVSGKESVWYSSNGSGGYAPDFFLRESLVKSGLGAAERYTRTEDDGTVTTFYGFDGTIAADRRGRLVSTATPGGTTTTAGYDATSHRLTTLSRSATVGTDTVVETLTYSYDGSNRLSGAVLTNQVNGGTVKTVRSTAYTYYDGTTAGGNANDLAKEELRDAAGTEIDTRVYRYYKPLSVTKLDYDNAMKTVTATIPGHDLVVGDLVTISGAAVAGDIDEFNGTFQVTSATSTTVTYAMWSVSGTADLDTGGAQVASAHARGYAGGLKMAFDAASYDRMVAAGVTTPTSASDAAVKPYLTNYYEYDGLGVVTKQIAQGEGCSSCSGGQGTYSYDYASSEHAVGHNAWRFKTVETLPDGNLNTTYTNSFGQVVLKVFEDVGAAKKWADYYRYNDDGQLLLHATPSAVSGFSELLADLVGYNVGTGAATHLYTDRGLIELTEYSSATSLDISDIKEGDVAGYLASTSIKRGTSDSPRLQQTTKYFVRTAGGATVYPVASSTVYRSDNGTGPQKTKFTYDWHPGTTQASLVITELPTVTTAQNGPNTAVTTKRVLDAFGRTTWEMDGDGFITATEYDPATGAVNKRIVDVNTTTATNEPTGWVTPSGGGLHLVTTMLVNEKGQTTKLTDPNGNVTHTVYNDAAHETRVYPGWNAATGTTTGPTQVMREDHGFKYTETLTMSATPLTSGSPGSKVPLGTEAISDVQSLSRDFVNDAGQLVESRRYHSLASVPYTALANLGAVNTNYYEEKRSYDLRGQVKRVEDALGTITWMLYDGLNRPTSTWVGTNDVGATNGHPEGVGGLNNMVKVSENAYDGSDGSTVVVGNSLLTTTTQFPGGGAAARVTKNSYDWRKRLIASENGVQTSESASDNTHVTSYVVLDNLGQTIESYTYDGDTLTIPRGLETGGLDTDPIPDQPTSGALRAKSTAEYDEWGRVFKSSTYTVNPSSGAVGTALVSNVWYDNRNNVIKSAAPGSAISKTRYDGVGRVTKTYVTNGGSDTLYSHAADVVGDIVLSQSAFEYDGNGNVTRTIAKQRFHDETATGELVDKSTAPKARISYQTAYYDAADRPTTMVDVGANSGSVYTRPGTAPSISTASTRITKLQYDDAGWLYRSTDPRGQIAQTVYDRLGQPTEVTENYVNGVSDSDVDDRITKYAYDGNGNVLTMTADLPSNDQVTQYVYGVTTGNGSAIDAKGLLYEVQYPNASTGAANSADRERYSYNAAGEVTAMTDRNGTTFTSAYDVLGRGTSVTAAVATTPTLNPQSLDTTVVKRTTAYNTQGLPSLFTSLNGSSVVVNQVQRDYNGLGQMTSEWQAISGAVSTTPSPTATPRVQYAYSEMVGGANHSRLTSMTYPDGRVVNYGYGTALQLNDVISRLSEMKDGSAALESYQYLGAGTVVYRAHDVPGLDQTLIGTGVTGDAGDKYIGLSNFGEVAQMAWFDRRDPSNGSDDLTAERLTYTYDANGNRVTRKLDTATGRDEKYAYDGLDRLTKVERGVLTGTTIGSVNYSQKWDGTDSSGLDALGNWKGVATDADGAGAGAVATQTRTHNGLNQTGTVSGQTSPTYDAAGNMRTDEANQRYKYDLWGQTVQVMNASNAVKVAYTYDALGRRVTEDVSTTNGGVGSDTSLYYSRDWQVVEARAGLTGGVGTAATERNFFSKVYVDALIRTDKIDPIAAGTPDTTFNGTGQRIVGLGAADDLTKAVLQADGKIVAAGNSGGKLALVRVLADGSGLDGSFGSSGIVLTNIAGGTDDNISDLTVQSDGRIVVVGGSNNRMVVARYNSNGTLDTSFGVDNSVLDPGTGVVDGNSTADGAEALNFGGSTVDRGYGVKIQPDGKIVIAGASANSSGDNDLVVVRLNANGSPDTTFGEDGPDALSVPDGFRRLDVSSGNDHGYQLTLQPNGRIVVAGDNEVGGNQNILVARFTDVGALDPDFDTDGKRVEDFGGDDQAANVDVDDLGRIVVGGKGGSGVDFVAARFTAAGALDNSFDGDGKKTIDFGSAADVGEDMVIDGMGRILVAGTTTNATTGSDFAITRLLPDGTFDNSFDGDGKEETDFATNRADAGRAMALQADGKIVVVGGTTSAGNTDVAIARYSGGGTTLYAIQDANWNVTGVADGTGTMVERYLQGPYGDQQVLNADYSNDADNVQDVSMAYLHQGGRRDASSGNFHFRNRDYRVTLGRWTQADPAGYADGATLYLYLAGSPLASTDAWGLQTAPTSQPASRPTTKPISPSDRVSLLTDLENNDWKLREQAERKLKDNIDRGDEDLAEYLRKKLSDLPAESRSRIQNVLPPDVELITPAELNLSISRDPDGKEIQIKLSKKMRGGFQIPEWEVSGDKDVVSGIDAGLAAGALEAKLYVKPGCKGTTTIKFFVTQGVRGNSKDLKVIVVD